MRLNPTSNDSGDPATGVPRILVPADIDTPDRIAWGLSFRQLTILAVGVGSVWAVYSRFPHALPPAAWGIIGGVVFAVSVVIALGRRDGLPLDVWVRHGLSMARAPAVMAPGAPVRGRALLAAPERPVTPAPLRPDATVINPDGVFTVDGTRHSMIACGTTSVTLRTGGEQAGLLEGFGRWLNALTGHTQIVVRAARHDLTPYASAVLDGAAALPHPALREAATDHARFLLALDTTREPLHRQVLTVITGTTLREAAARDLTGLGITAAPLDGGAVTAALAAALDPYDPPVPGPRAVPGTAITTERTP